MPTGSLPRRLPSHYNKDDTDEKAAVQCHGGVGLFHAILWFMGNLEWREGEDWEVSFIELAMAFTLQTGMKLANHPEKEINIKEAGQFPSAAIARIETLCGGRRTHPGLKGKDIGGCQGKAGKILGKIQCQEV